MGRRATSATRTELDRMRHLAYLHSHPEQMAKARERARIAADKRRRANPALSRKLEIYERLIELQGGEHCAICGKQENDLGRRFAIDHDWETDEIRGLLCRRCNHAIGNTRKQGMEWLAAAVAYLERPLYTGIKHEEVRKVNRIEYGALKGQPTDEEAA